MTKYDNLHAKAHRLYFDKSVRENMPVLWQFVEFATQAWIESGGKQRLEEYLLERGCPEYDIVSKRVFQLCIYYDSNWALVNLDYQDLKEWSEEHLLDVHTMLELRNYFVQNSKGEGIVMEQTTTDMQNYALQKLALESIRHELYNDWKTLDKIGELWKSKESSDTFTNFATTWFIRHNRAEYEEKYHDLLWVMDNLPRYMLQRWCNGHDFDFLTVCRVVDDREIFV